MTSGEEKSIETVPSQSASPSNTSDSPYWSRSTKVIVTVLALIVSFWIAYRFQGLIGQIVGAAILAYILNPVVEMLDRKTGLKRSRGILIVYFLLAIAFVAAGVALGVAAFQQVNSLVRQVPVFVESIATAIETFATEQGPIMIGDFTIYDANTFNWQLVRDQLLGLVNPLVGRSGQILQGLTAATFRWISIFFFVFVISIYIANEIPRLGDYIGQLAQQPGYRKDAERIMREFGRIWRAYLRGQIILGVVIFVIVWLGLAMIGVQNSLALGIVSGVLEFIPVIGPVVGAITAMVVAFFQPENYMGLSPWLYSGVVLLFMFLVQQIENSVLVPRIVGEALDLHPLIVMVGVFMGSSLAGILGAILAAPIVATFKLLGLYAWRKMFDLPPFPKPEPDEPPPAPSLIERSRALLARISKS